jgi:hypothetical protein
LDVTLYAIDTMGGTVSTEWYPNVTIRRCALEPPSWRTSVLTRSYCSSTNEQWIDTYISSDFLDNTDRSPSDADILGGVPAIPVATFNSSVACTMGHRRRQPSFRSTAKLSSNASHQLYPLDKRVHFALNNDERSDNVPRRYSSSSALSARDRLTNRSVALGIGSTISAVP